MGNTVFDPVPPSGIPDRVRTMVDTLLIRSPAQPFIAARNSHRLTVLAYHDVADEESFRRHIEYLKRAMCPVSLSEVLSGLPGESAMPGRPVLVTFDDADRTIYERALPILREFEVPAVAFVVAGHLDTERPFWWREVGQLISSGARVSGVSGDVDSSLRVLKAMPDPDRRRIVRALRRSLPGARTGTQNLKRSELPALEAAGISIGNHTFTHPILDRCSESRVRSEIIRAHRVLCEAIGGAVRAFAYPNGNYDRRAENVMRELDYKAAFLFDHRVARFPPEDAFRISRVRVNSTTPLSRFKLITSGLHPAVHHAIGRA